MLINNCILVEMALVNPLFSETWILPKLSRRAKMHHIRHSVSFSIIEASFSDRRYIVVLQDLDSDRMVAYC